MSNSRNIPAFDFDVSAWPALPRRRGLFVTGTDTGVGKTLIAGAIARSLRRSGKAVEVFKPVATGCRRARGQLVSQDAEFLAACAGSLRMLSEVCPIRYRSAVAPNVAAELERRPMDLELLFREYTRIVGDPCVAGIPPASAAAVSAAETSPHSVASEGKMPSPRAGETPAARRRRLVEPFVVVEGVGGLLCPITDDLWVIHLARLMALPLVIVARAGLGTINHTLLTLHAARSAGLAVAGVVLNRYLIDPLVARDKTPEELHQRGDVDMAMFTNPRQVESRGRVKVLALVPEDKDSSVEDARIGPDVQFAVDQVDWEALAGSARSQ